MVDKTLITSTATTTATGAASGKTTIVDPVIAKIAGIAAREVPGVFALGGGAARAIGAIRGVIGGADLSQGIKVEVGETQVAVDINIVVEYPQPLQHVADGVRAAVAAAVEQLVGMEVTEINVTVSDVHIAGEEPTEAETRVA